MTTTAGGTTTGSRTGSGAASGTGGTGGGNSSSTPVPGAVSSVAQIIASNLANGSSGSARPIGSLYEMIGTQVSVPSGSNNVPPTLISCPLNDAGQIGTLLPNILDKLTTVNGSEMPARINVNTAPQGVLAAIGFSPADVSNIMGARPIPSAAPVIRATFPSKSMGFLHALFPAS